LGPEASDRTGAGTYACRKHGGYLPGLRCVAGEGDLRVGLGALAGHGLVSFAKKSA